MIRKCQSCKVTMGEVHKSDCELAVCALYGLKEFFCEELHEIDKSKHSPSVFNGFAPGEVEAITRGWFIKATEGKGKYKTSWVSTSADDPDAMPDATRVMQHLDWYPEAQMFIEPGSIPNFESGQNRIREILAVWRYLNEVSSGELVDQKDTLNNDVSDIKKSRNKKKTIKSRKPKKPKK